MGLDLTFQRFAREVENSPGAYAPPSGALLIARIDDEPAGMVALRRLDDRQCEMKRLYVRPQTRGAGVGRHLVERVIAEARARIIHERCALVNNAPAAMSFLAAAGFDTAPSAVLKTSPGLVLSEGPRMGPESKPGGRTIRAFMNSPG